MRWSWLLLATGCTTGEAGWLNQLASSLGDPTSVDDMVLRENARILLQAPVDPDLPSDVTLVSSDPSVLDVHPLDESSMMWAGVDEGTLSPMNSADQAIGMFADEDQTFLAVELRSGQAGDVELSWVDGVTGDVVDTIPMSVRATARRTYGPANQEGWDVLAAAAPTVHVLEGASYVLRVTALDADGEVLSGWTDAPSADEALTRLELVQTTPDADQPGVRRVAPDDVVALDLRPGTDADGDAGVLLVGIDRAGHDVLGIPASFTPVDPTTASRSAGDFFRYADDPAAPEVDVVASWNGLSASVPVHTAYPGMVASSDTVGVGCSTAGRAASPTALLVGVALFLLQRQRTRISKGSIASA